MEGQLAYLINLTLFRQGARRVGLGSWRHLAVGRGSPPKQGSRGEDLDLQALPLTRQFLMAIRLLQRHVLLMLCVPPRKRCYGQ